MTDKINLTDTYTTRDGRPARVLCVDAEGKWPVVALVGGLVILYDDDGCSDVEHMDLIPAPKTHKVVLWVNINKDGKVMPYLARDVADHWAVDRIACIRVEVTAREGQYDE